MSTFSDSLRILVVDDDQPFTDSIVLLLRARGYTAMGAYDAYDASLCAEDFHPQALISDLSMPGMNGIELARFFAERHPLCRVLLMSGNPGACVLANEFGYPRTVLPKPVDPAHILAFAESCAGTTQQEEPVRLSA